MMVIDTISSGHDTKMNINGMDMSERAPVLFNLRRTGLFPQRTFEWQMVEANLQSAAHIDNFVFPARKSY